MLLVNYRIMENPSCTFAAGNVVYWKAVAFHTLGKAFPGLVACTNENTDIYNQREQMKEEESYMEKYFINTS